MPVSGKITRAAGRKEDQPGPRAGKK